MYSLRRSARRSPNRKNEKDIRHGNTPVVGAPHQELEFFSHRPKAHKKSFSRIIGVSRRGKDELAPRRSKVRLCVSHAVVDCSTYAPAVYESVPFVPSHDYDDIVLQSF